MAAEVNENELPWDDDSLYAETEREPSTRRRTRERPSQPPVSDCEASLIQRFR